MTLCDCGCVLQSFTAQRIDTDSAANDSRPSSRRAARPVAASDDVYGDVRRPTTIRVIDDASESTLPSASEHDRKRLSVARSESVTTDANDDVEQSEVIQPRKQLFTAIYWDYFGEDKPLRWIRYRPGMDVGNDDQEPLSSVQQEDRIGDAVLFDVLQVNNTSCCRELCAHPVSQRIAMRGHAVTRSALTCVNVCVLLPCFWPFQLCDISATVADARVVTNPDGETCVQYAIVVSMISEVCSKMCISCGVNTNHRGDLRCFAVYRGFREFHDLQTRLAEEFPHAEGLPSLPSRTLFRSYDPRFISDRRASLRAYVLCMPLASPSVTTATATVHSDCGIDGRH